MELRGSHAGALAVRFCSRHPIDLGFRKFTELSAFVAVAEEMSFTKAANWSYGLSYSDEE
jgi:hypothetical protein